MTMRAKRKTSAMDVIRGRGQKREIPTVADQMIGYGFGEIQCIDADGDVESTPAILAVGPVERRTFRRVARRLEATERIVIRLAPDRADVVLETGEGRADEVLFRETFMMQGFHEFTAYVTEDMPEGKEVGEVLLVCPHDKKIAMRVKAPLEVEQFDEPFFCRGEEVLYGKGAHCAISFDFRTGSMVTRRFESAEEAMAVQEANLAADQLRAEVGDGATAPTPHNESVASILRSVCSSVEAA